MNTDQWQDYEYSHKRLEQIKAFQKPDGLGEITFNRLYSAGVLNLINSDVFVQEDKVIAEEMIKGAL